MHVEFVYGLVHSRMRKCMKGYMCSKRNEETRACIKQDILTATHTRTRSASLFDEPRKNWKVPMHASTTLNRILKHCNDKTKRCNNRLLGFGSSLRKSKRPLNSRKLLSRRNAPPGARGNRSCGTRLSLALWHAGLISPCPVPCLLGTPRFRHHGHSARPTVA